MGAIFCQSIEQMLQGTTERIALSHQHIQRLPGLRRFIPATPTSFYTTLRPCRSDQGHRTSARARNPSNLRPAGIQANPD